MPVRQSKEIWKPIPGYKGWYEASTLGRIRSVNRIIIDTLKRKRFLKGKLLSLIPTNDTGHVSCTLYKNCVGKSYEVHQLIALTFIGKRPKGKEVCHNNGIGDDNIISNLRYDTHKNNYVDAVKHNVMPHGEHNGHSKLTNKQIIKIRLAYREGTSIYKLGNKYNVSATGCIWPIIKRKTWNHV